MAQANVKLTVDATGATRALQGVQNKTNQLQKAFGGLRTAIAGVGISVLAKRTILAATSFEKLNQRLKILTKDNGTYSQSLKLAEDAQTKFGLSSIDALEGVTNLQARLAPLGSTMDEISAIFNGFNTAAILSGASTQEQAGAMRQLTQALGSGVLRGDEFNSISEQMSAVLKPIADQLGVNVGALRDMAAQGKITKDVVVAAFKEIEKQGSKALKELIKNDPTMVFKVLSNETEKLSITVGSLLAPAVLDALRTITNLTRAVTEFVQSPIGKTAAIFTGIALAVKGFTGAITLLTAVQTILIVKFKATTIGAIAFAKASATASIATKALAISTGALSIALNALPLVGLATAFGLVTTAIIRNNQEQKKYNDLVKQGGEEEIKAAIKTLEAREAVLEIQRRGGSLRREALENIREQIVELQNRLKIVKDGKNAIDETTNATGKLSEAFTKVGDNIATGVSDALHDAVMQTKSLGDAARSILQGIASDLLRLGINTFLKGTFGGIFSNLPGFANGGRPPVGRASLVGEKGPEIFVPSTAGTIIPNNKIGGMSGPTNIVVNVDASGSNVEGNEDEGKQLGIALSAAIESELIKQKRPGGLLA